MLSNSRDLEIIEIKIASSSTGGFTLNLPQEYVVNDLFQTPDGSTILLVSGDGPLQAVQFEFVEAGGKFSPNGDGEDASYLVYPRKYLGRVQIGNSRLYLVGAEQRQSAGGPADLGGGATAIG